MKYQIEKLQDVNLNLCRQLRNYCYNINGCCQLVHTELGPFLNEYIYQDALEICFQENSIRYKREFYFSIDFHGQRIRHRHFVDFLVEDKVMIECKATECLSTEHRQQLWNYMRLTNTRIGILWNFAPVKDQNEHYYLDTEKNVMFMF